MDFDLIATANWFPGHMRKAERQITEKLKLIDVVVELVDARAPLSSQNARLQELCQHKAKVLVLTKSDLADHDVTQRWLHEFRNGGTQCICVHRKQRDIAKRIAGAMQRADENARKARGARTPRLHPVRGIIIGLPNVGKSSLINSVVRRKQTKTGPTPGVTRHQQWVKLPDGLELLDTPGVMPPRIHDSETGLKLGVVASIKDAIIGVELLCEYLLFVWKKQRCKEFMERYHLPEWPASVQDFLDNVGRHAGYLKSAEEIDRQQAAALVLREFREGILGQISLEIPENFPKR